MKREDVHLETGEVLWIVYYLTELKEMFKEVLENGSELQDEQKEKLWFPPDREILKYDFPFCRDRAAVQMDTDKIERILYQVESQLSKMNEQENMMEINYERT